MIDLAPSVLSEAPARCTCRRKPTIDPLALSAADIGRLLGVSQRQIYAWHAAGTLGPVPVSLSERVTRWDRREIEAWWLACRAAGRPITRSEWIAMQTGPALRLVGGAGR